MCVLIPDVKMLIKDLLEMKNLTAPFSTPQICSIHFLNYLSGWQARYGFFVCY